MLNKPEIKTHRQFGGTILTKELADWLRQEHAAGRNEVDLLQETGVSPATIRAITAGTVSGRDPNAVFKD